MNEAQYEVIIVGGSYAGLAAALKLGRSLRKTLIIDSGKPCNAQTPYSHNFLTQDRKTPKQIYNTGKEQVEKYDTVKFYTGKAVYAEKINRELFCITTEKGEKFTSKKLILATGISDEIPDIKGYSECWGISLVHCPYCHGYEYKGKKTALIGNSDAAFNLALLIKNLTDDITVLTCEPADFVKEQKTALERNNIKIVESEITELQHQNGMAKNILFTDGTAQNFDTVYAGFSFHQNSDLAEQLGCEFRESGYIKKDQCQRTTIPGVFVCGDNSSMMRTVSNAALTGNIAGAIVNTELAEESFYG